jgi:hypothetical protein
MSKKNVSKVEKIPEKVEISERIVSTKETVANVVKTFVSFKMAVSELEGKTDKDTFILSVKGVEKKINRLYNKASRNDILKALREGKHVVVMSDESASPINEA